MFTVPFVTERFGSIPYRDCAWAAALMLYLKASRGKVPATSAEVSALRTASGDTQGGSTANDAINGLQTRYGFKPEVVTSESAVLAKLANGYGASIGLTYELLPAYLRTQKTGVIGGHRVYIEDYRASDGTVRWVDPLRPDMQAIRVKVTDIAPAVWWHETLMAKEGSAGGANATRASYTTDQWNTFIADLHAVGIGVSGRTNPYTLKAADIPKIMEIAAKDGIDLSGVDWTQFYGKTLSDLRDSLATQGTIPGVDLSPGSFVPGLDSIAASLRFVLDPQNWVHTGGLLIGIGLTVFGAKIVLTSK